MKLIKLLIAALAWLPYLGLAQVSPPELFNYQGQLLTATGTNIANGNSNLTFSIYSAQSPGGTLLWGPVTKSNVPVVSGFFNVVLGGPPDPSLVGVFATSQTAFLQIQAGPSAITPRQQILTAPYSFNSAKLNGYGWDALFSGGSPASTLLDSRLSANVALRSGGNAFSGNQIVSVGNVGIGTNNPAERLDVVGNIRMSGTNPSPNLGFSKTLTPGNLISSWGLVNVTAAGPAINLLNGFNVSSIGPSGDGSFLYIAFATPLTTDKYAIQLQDGKVGGGVPAPITYQPDFFSSDRNGFLIRVIGGNWKALSRDVSFSFLVIGG